MSRFVAYSPEQAYLIPPTVKEALGEGHFCFFVQKMVSKLDLGAIEAAYSDEGGNLYHPALMLSVWLYGYGSGITAGRELERRIVEDLPLRYLAGGARPDHWALSAFRRRHVRAMNDVFTQVTEFIRDQGLGKLGVVAVDGTPIEANNSKSQVDTVKKLREQRAKFRRQIRRWQKRCDAEDRAAAVALNQTQMEKVEKELETIPGRLQQLRKSGLKQLPQTDKDARVLKNRGKSVVGYKAETAVSEDHFIVAQQVTQAAAENDLLVPMVEQVEGNCDESPGKVLADAGLYSNDNVRVLEEKGIDAYVPDSNMAAALNRGTRVKGRAKAPEMQRMRRKLRSGEGRKQYARRKAIAEAPFGTLKAQRNMRRFRLRGLEKTGIEFTLFCTGYNLTRLHQELDPNSELWRRRRARERKKHQQKDRIPKAVPVDQGFQGCCEQPRGTRCKALNVLTHPLKPRFSGSFTAGLKVCSTLGGGKAAP
jgi:transposase/ribosomal protein S19E (S16A)